jgi:hypothetical protein
MARIDHGGWLLPGDNPAIDRAGWQCTAPDPTEDRGRCRLLATHTHRRRNGNRVHIVPLCKPHFDLAEPPGG